MDWCKFLIEGDKYIIVILRIKQEACTVLILRHYLFIYVYMCVCVSWGQASRQLLGAQTRWEGGEGRGGQKQRLSLNLHPAYNYIVLDNWINGQEGWLSPRLVLCVCMYTAAAASRCMYCVGLERWWRRCVCAPLPSPPSTWVGGMDTHTHIYINK